MIRYLITALLLFVVNPLASIAQSVQPTVLAELFRNDNCDNCYPPDMKFEAFVASNPAVALINYNNANADGQDPFYLASNPSGTDRDFFYGGVNVGLSDPNAYIDGIAGGENAESTWELYATTGLTQDPLLSIPATIGFGPEGIDTISFSVTGSVGKSVIAYVAIKESNLVYDNTKKYGDPPNSIWNDVFRSMLPTPNGSASFSLSGTNKFSVIYDPSNYIAYTGLEQNMTAIIFAQDVDVATGGTNTNSHQVEAIGEISMAPPSAVATQSVTSAPQLIIPNNPIVRQGLIEVQLPQSGQAKIVLSDLLGRELRTIVDEMMPRGETTFSIQSLNLPSGIYFADLLVDGVDVSRVKFAFLK